MDHLRAVTPVDLDRLIQEESEATWEFLLELIRFRSLSGAETKAAHYLLEAFSAVAETTEAIQFPQNLKNDPEYSCPIRDIKYGGRFNVRVQFPGYGTGKTLLFNTHLDVVPASPNQLQAFEPCRKNGSILGRGACDAKGQIATLYLVLRLLRRLPRQPRAGVILHLVMEEEVGGNGTLAMIRGMNHDALPDAAVVMEPTGGRIVTSVRGAVWFRLYINGRPGHSGSADQTISALRLAVEAMEILETLHTDLLEESKGISLFDKFSNPMPITFGRLEAGDWPASAPAQAWLEGVFGFLPNKTRDEIAEMMTSRLMKNGSLWLRDRFALDFTYRHDAHVISPNHVLPKRFQEAASAAGIPSEISAFPASCDSWFYNNLLGIPTVVYGPGDLAFAHAVDEQIKLADICDSAHVLSRLILGWT